MNKKLLALAFCSLFSVSAVHAAEPAPDGVKNVNISGTLSGSALECLIDVPSTVTLTDGLDSMTTQGMENGSTNYVPVSFSLMSNDENMSGKPCINKVSIELHGDVDSGQGTVLANKETGESAAKAVGVGVYDADHKPLSPVGGTIKPTDTITTLNLALVKLAGAETATAGTVHSSLTLDVVRL